MYCNKMTRIGNERKIANVVNRGAERSLLNEKRVRKRALAKGLVEIAKNKSEKQNRNKNTKNKERKDSSIEANKEESKA